jgi:hypothetical protein
MPALMSSFAVSLLLLLLLLQTPQGVAAHRHASVPAMTRRNSAFMLKVAKRKLTLQQLSWACPRTTKLPDTKQ